MLHDLRPLRDFGLTPGTFYAVHILPQIDTIMIFLITSLPPASEGWGKVIFSVCSHLWGGGYPISGLVGGVPHPRSGWGGTPSQVWVGGTRSQVWMVGGKWGTPTMTGWGTSTMTGWGTPHCDWMGYPHHDWIGYHPTMTGWGTPTMTAWGTPPPTSIASTCCVAGGMPVAFTQEDFLVQLNAVQC